MGKKSKEHITNIKKLVQDIKDYFDEWVDASSEEDLARKKYKEVLHDEWDAAEKSLVDYLTEQGKYNQYKLLKFEQQNKFRGSWKQHKVVQNKLGDLEQKIEIQSALKVGAKKSILEKRKVLEKKMADFKSFLDKKVDWFGKTSKGESKKFYEDTKSWLDNQVFKS